MVTYIAMYPLCETLRGNARGITSLSLCQHFVATACLSKRRITSRSFCLLKISPSNGVLGDPTTINEEATALVSRCTRSQPRCDRDSRVTNIKHVPVSTSCKNNKKIIQLFKWMMNLSIITISTEKIIPNTEHLQQHIFLYAWQLANQMSLFTWIRFFRCFINPFWVFFTSSYDLAFT